MQIEKLFQELEKAVNVQKTWFGLNIDEKTFMKQRQKIQDLDMEV